MSKFLWCEDSKSGFQFWRAILRELHPDVTVETKGSKAAFERVGM